MKRQKECFIGVSAVVHLFLKIAGAMPVVFLLFLVVNVLHGTAWALETLARQVFLDGLQSAVERNSLQAAYSGDISFKIFNTQNADPNRFMSLLICKNI